MIIGDVGELSVVVGELAATLHQLVHHVDKLNTLLHKLAHRTSTHTLDASTRSNFLSTTLQIFQADESQSLAYMDILDK